MYWSRHRTSCPLYDRHDSSLTSRNRRRGAVRTNTVEPAHEYGPEAEGASKGGSAGQRTRAGYQGEPKWLCLVILVALDYHSRARFLPSDTSVLAFTQDQLTFRYFAIGSWLSEGCKLLALTPRVARGGRPVPNHRRRAGTCPTGRSSRGNLQNPKLGGCRWGGGLQQEGPGIEARPFSFWQ